MKHGTQIDTAGDCPDCNGFTAPFVEGVDEKRTGWQCPKCDTVYGPHVDQCRRCNGLNETLLLEGNENHGGSNEKL